jgi:hypothetical protein
MRTRIYWLLPDPPSARAAMHTLLQARIDYRDMHFVGADGVDMRGLPAATVLQSSDLVRSAEMGLIIGASMGALMGTLVAVNYPIVGDEPQWDLALMLAIAGALFGPWASSMIGISAPNERLKRFAPQIEQGQVLLMVDLPIWLVEQIEARLRALQLDAQCAAAARDIPAFP